MSKMFFLIHSFHFLAHNNMYYVQYYNPEVCIYVVRIIYTKYNFLIHLYILET